jgi:hypothetical protein
MVNQEYQAYKKTLIEINKILGYENDMRKTFSEDGSRKIKQSLNIVTNQMERVYKNEHIEPSVEEKSLVRETVNLFVDIALGKPITAIFRDLSSTYLLLIFNWNQTLGKRPDIERDIKLVDMGVKGQLTMLDTIRVLRQLLPKMEAMGKYEPPAFNLSRAYLDSLKEEIENQGSKSKRSRSKKKKPNSKKSK